MAGIHLRRACGCLALLISAACVTTQLTPAGERVRLTSNPEAVRGCRLLGEVVGSDGMNGGMVGQRAAEENAVRRLKNEAGKLGGNVVLLVSETTGPSGSTQRGEAYRCS